MKRSAIAGEAARSPAGGANELAGGARTLASSSWISSRRPAGGAAWAGGASPNNPAGGAKALAGGASTLASSTAINSRMPAGGAARAGGNSPKLPAGGAKELAGGASTLSSSRRIELCNRTSPIVATCITSFLCWDRGNSDGGGAVFERGRSLSRFFLFASVTGPSLLTCGQIPWCTRRGSNPHLPTSKTGPFVQVVDSGSRRADCLSVSCPGC